MNPDEKGLQMLGMQMQGGTLSRVSPNATKDEQTAVLNNIVDHLNDTLKSQVYSDDNSKRYIQGYSAGRWPSGDFGVAISAEGDDVTKVPFESLIFAWDFSTNKQYIRKGSQEFTGGIQEFKGGTQIFYDPDSDKDFMQSGILPDGTGGTITAKPGYSVKDDIYG